MLIFTFSLAHRLAYWLPFELTRIQCAIRLPFSAWAQKKETPFGISLVLYAASVSRLFLFATVPCGFPQGLVPEPVDGLVLFVAMP